MSADWAQAAIACLALIVNVLVLLFLVRQLNLFKIQITDSRTAQLKQLELLETEITDSRMSRTEELKLLGNQVSASQKSLQQSTEQQRVDSERGKKQATLDFIGVTIEKQHDLFGKLRTDSTFMSKAADRDTVEYLVVRDYLSYLEDLAVGVNIGIFDTEVVDRSIGGRIIRAWFDLYGNWILKERTDLKSERLYEELQKLAIELRDMRNSPEQSVGSEES